MTDIQIFQSEQFGAIRTLAEDGRMLFAGSDVAKALGYSNTNDAIRRHCPSVVKRDVGVQTGFKADGSLAMQDKEMSFIPESDVYRLIFRSQLPEAEQFEKWVCEDILPAIRKTGMYATDELLANPDLAIAAFTALKEERAKNIALEAQAKADKPKVLFASAVEAAKTSILIGDMAKLLKQNGVETGQKRLFQWLRDNGYLIKRDGADRNMPTQRAMELGLFEVKESTVANPDGSIRITRTPKVTGKGQLFFVAKLVPGGST